MVGSDSLNLVDRISGLCHLKPTKRSLPWKLRNVDANSSLGATRAPGHVPVGKGACRGWGCARKPNCWGSVAVERHLSAQDGAPCACLR